MKIMGDRSSPPMLDDKDNINKNKCNGVSTVQETYREQCSHSESQPEFSQEHFPKMVPSDDGDAWLKYKGDEYNKAGSSPTSMLTPYSSTNEMSADQYAKDSPQLRSLR